jgi:hypothetical protein
MGEAGVTKALEIIHKELDLSMAFCGRTPDDGSGQEHPVAGQLSDSHELSNTISARPRSA